MAKKRKTKEFLIDKMKGQQSEKQFMEYIAVTGGTAHSIGTIPGNSDQTPRFTRPNASTEKGYCFSVSPDIIFTLPNQPRGFASLAQVKLRKVYQEPSKQWLYVYLDEKELHRMNVANMFYHVIFVAHMPELAGVSGFHEWMWLSVDQLKESKTRLLKRNVCGTPTFLLPLENFQPLHKLGLHSICKSANSNVPSSFTE